MLTPFMIPNVLEAGCDEAGRGCLCGSVFAAAVILPPTFNNELLNDSKQLTEQQRYELRPIIEKEAIAWSIGEVCTEEIDQINILNASILAMHRALDKLTIRPEHILVDGNRFKPYHFIPYRTVVHGDATYMSIAAASVLAKTYRDDYMLRLHTEYPQYGWDKNKGYPTLAHRKAVCEYGESPFHRKTFHFTTKDFEKEKINEQPPRQPIKNI